MTASGQRARTLAMNARPNEPVPPVRRMVAPDRSIASSLRTAGLPSVIGTLHGIVELSVVVPTFRRPTALSATLDAVTSATAPPGGFEVIVVDDGSGDTTPDVIRAAAERPGVPVHLLTQPNRGVAAAR